MAKARYYLAASLDGFIADADDGIDWLQGFQGTYPAGEGAASEAIDSFLEEIGSLVMGSATYGFILRESARWPYGDRPTWVLTSRDLKPMDGADIRFFRGKVADFKAEVIAAAGERDVWVLGGGNVANQCAEAGLLDEVIVTVVPVVLGGGKPLFERALDPKLALTGTRAFENGMVELSYAVGG